jgi:hypothetical protein
MIAQTVKNIVNSGKENGAKGIGYRRPSCCLFCKYQGYYWPTDESTELFMKCDKFDIEFGRESLHTDATLAFITCSSFKTYYIKMDESHFKSAMYHLKCFVIINIRRLYDKFCRRERHYLFP